MFSSVNTRFVSLLRWSEKYMKTDMVYLVSGGFWFTLGQIISTLAAFFVALAFANFLPQATYGTYKYILAIAGIFSLFTLPNMADAVTRAVARGEDGTIRAATRERVLWSFMGSAIALAGAGYYHFVGGNDVLAAALAVVACTLPLFDTFTLYDSYLSGKRQFSAQAKYHALMQVVSVPILIVTAYFTSNLVLILLAYFVPLIAARFAVNRLIFSRVPREASTDPETLSYGKHLTVMNVLSVVAGNVDKILLFKFLGATDLALYTFAVAIPEQLKGPLKGVAAIALPKFAAQSPEQIRAGIPAMKRKMLWYALGILAVAVVYIPLAPYVYGLLFPKYIGSVLYSQVFMFSAIGLVGTIPLAILSAHKKTREQYFFFTSQPVLQIILYLVCIPLWGIMGAIVARVLMRILYVFQSTLLLETSFTESET